MPAYPEIFVLRHGQTEWNVEGRYQGRKESALTKAGLAQAADQGRILQEVLGKTCRLPSYCSPQPRALRTAEIALAGLGLTARPDPRLMETGFGEWEGKTRQEIAQDYAGLWRESDPLRIFSAPGGEGFIALQARCRAFLASLTEPSIIVSHGVTTAVLRGLWLGLSAEEMMALPKGQGCVYHLTAGVERVLTL